MTPQSVKPDWAQGRRERDNAQRIAAGLKPKRQLWPWALIVLVVIGIAAFVFLRPAPPAEVAVEDAAPVAVQLRQSETVAIAPTTLRETVKVTGTMVPGQQADVASQASGRVMAVLLQPGDRVKEGDVLAQIDRATLEIQLSQQRATADATRAQLQSSQQQLERTEQLATQGLASPSALEQARSAAAALSANLVALESAVKSAELALANATVKAPLTGIISSRSVDTGQTIAAGTPLFTIVNLDRMEFDAAASVNSSARVVAGQEVAVSVTGLEGQQFSGVVTRVNPVAVTGTRTVPIYIELANTDSRLRGGMFATGYITIEQKPEAIAVPAASLREDAEGSFVLALIDGTLQRKAVTVVRQWDRGRTVEVDGLAAGDVIVAAPLADLTAGDAYQLVEG